MSLSFERTEMPRRESKSDVRNIDTSSLRQHPCIHGFFHKEEGVKALYQRRGVPKGGMPIIGHLIAFMYVVTHLVRDCSMTENFVYIYLNANDIFYFCLFYFCLAHS